MRPLMLALTPLLLFTSALIVGSNSDGDSTSVQYKIPLVPYEPQEIKEPEPLTPIPDTFSDDGRPESDQNASPSPTPIFIEMTVCSDGKGTTAYKNSEGIQIQPISSESAECQRPAAILTGGKEYFGCFEGKIILDCDWFVQSDSLRAGGIFGSSYLEDFTMPDISGFDCENKLVEADSLLRIGGKVCDLRDLAGNIGQMHGG